MRSITDVFFATAIDLYDHDTITVYLKNIFGNITTPCILTKIASNDVSNLYHVSCHIERMNDYTTFEMDQSFGSSLNGDDINYNRVQELINHDALIPPPGIDTYSVNCYMQGAYEQFQSAITIFVN